MCIAGQAEYGSWCTTCHSPNSKFRLMTLHLSRRQKLCHRHLTQRYDWNSFLEYWNYERLHNPDGSQCKQITQWPLLTALLGTWKGPHSNVGQVVTYYCSFWGHFTIAHGMPGLTLSYSVVTVWTTCIHTMKDAFASLIFNEFHSLKKNQL